MVDTFQVVLYVAGAIALLAIAWFFISLSSTIRGVRGVLDSLGKVVEGVIEEIKGLRTSLQGTIQNVELITSRVPVMLDRVNDTVDRVNGQLAQVEGIMGSVRQLSDGLADDLNRITADATDIIHAAKGVAISLIDFEQNIQTKMQRPVVELVSVFSALGSGIHAFRMKLAPNGNGVNGVGTPTVRSEEMAAADGRMVGPEPSSTGY